MFISSPPPFSALRPKHGVANVFQTYFCPSSAHRTLYPKTPRFLHIYAAFEPFSLIPVYSFLVLFFKTTNDNAEIFIIEFCSAGLCSNHYIVIIPITFTHWMFASISCASRTLFQMIMGEPLPKLLCCLRVERSWKR